MADNFGVITEQGFVAGQGLGFMEDAKNELKEKDSQTEDKKDEE